MSKRLNQKGFTLVELLAVLVILAAIMRIAIPSLSSSFERTKDKQNQGRYKMIESAAEQYVTDHKNVIYNTMGNNVACYIQIKNITLLTSEEMKDANGNDLSENYIIFTKPSDYKYSITKDELESCI